MIRIQKHIEDSNLPLDIIKPVNNSTIQPLKLIKPDVDTYLSEFKKNETNPLVFKTKINRIQTIKNNLQLIYKPTVQRTEIKLLLLQ